MTSKADAEIYGKDEGESSAENGNEERGTNQEKEKAATAPAPAGMKPGRGGG